MNLYPEYEALKNYNSKTENYNQRGRYLIYKTLVEMILRDPESACDYKQYEVFEICRKIREGGVFLNKAGGLDEMTRAGNPLFWSFIPKNMRNLVDTCFDGIGEYKSGQVKNLCNTFI